MNSSDHQTGILFTIGHSTRSADEFINLLELQSVRLLIDVRRFPYSRKYPHFNTDVLQKSLAAHGIAYRHIQELGGRRSPRPDSVNTVWRNASFRGYADYMQTPEFIAGITELEALALQQVSAIMCSEAVWWRCHRALISDYLAARGWKVMHILSATNVPEHTFTKPARVENRTVVYTALPESDKQQHLFGD